MMIQVVLGNPHHPEYGVATIPFPIGRFGSQSRHSRISRPSCAKGSRMP